METLAIRIKIADREYPMRVKPEDEGKIRQAGKLINEKLRRYKSEFGLDDHQDLLAMVAFDAMVEVLGADEVNAVDSDHLKTSIQHINAMLSGAL